MSVRSGTQGSDSRTSNRQFRIAPCATLYSLALEVLSSTFLVGSLLAVWVPAAAQAAREDVATLDDILRAYYEVVSGPAGEPADRARDESLHHPAARVGIPGTDDSGRATIHMMTLGEYHDRAGGPRSAPFYEWEIHRVVQQFGAVAHVWSTYASSDTQGGRPTDRGINSIQLYYDGDRWWITSWIFDRERTGNPIPAEYLPRR